MEKKLLVIIIIAGILILGIGLVYGCIKRYEEKLLEEEIEEDKVCWDIYNQKIGKLGTICYLPHWDNETNQIVQGDCYIKRIQADLLYSELIVCVGI